MKKENNVNENKVTQLPYYWLNPSLDKDKRYMVHINPIQTIKDSGHQQWVYSRNPPEAYPLAWRCVNVPHLLTSEEKEEIKNAETAEVKDENQNDILRVVAKSKKSPIKYEYIGDTEPIAQGVTAYFIKRTPRMEDDYGSVLSLLKRDADFDIYSWYNEYWKDQISFAEQINRKKTKPQGRLTDEAFQSKFIKDHMIQEEELLRKSERFFSDDNPCTDNYVISQIRAYVDGYLEWVAEKSQEIVVGYKTDKTREQLMSFFECLVNKDILKRDVISRDDFVDIFSGQSMRTRVVYKGSKKRLASIINRLTGKKANHKEVNQRFVFPNTACFNRKDFPKKEMHGLMGCYEGVFENSE